jgi:TIR domain
MAKQVFISHSAEPDGAFAQQLASDLEQAGLPVWMAPQSIQKGESFPTAIDRGLSGSSYFLLVLSPASLGSPWVKNEIAAALEMEAAGRVQIIPLVVQRSVAPPLLMTKQAISFVEDYAKGLKELFNALGVPGSNEVRGSADHRPSQLLRKAADSRGHARDPFVEGTLLDLHRSMSVHGYLMSPVEEERGSIVVAVVENNTNLRIGISIHPDAGLPKNDLLAQVSRGLLNNSHGVSGVFAIQNSRQTEMAPCPQRECHLQCHARHVERSAWARGARTRSRDLLSGAETPRASRTDLKRND